MDRSARRAVSPALLALLLATPGCTSVDLSSEKLETGSRAVVAFRDADVPQNGPARPSITMLSPEGVLWSLDPGVRVTVGHDPGYYDLTREEIERGRGATRGTSPEGRDARDEPGRFYPPHWRARHRPVSIVVESGRHAGKAGRVDRENLRPSDGAGDPGALAATPSQASPGAAGLFPPSR